MESPGTGVQRRLRERTWGKIQKGQKVKSHIWQKWKSESEKVILVNNKIEKVNEVNGEFGEYTEKI